MNIKSMFMGQLVKQVFSNATKKATGLTAEMLLAEANKTVPLETGHLRSTGRVTHRSEEVAIISYDTPYAVRLHENPQYNFQGQGRGKWLERTLQEQGARVLGSLAGPFRGLR